MNTKRKLAPNWFYMESQGKALQSWENITTLWKNLAAYIAILGRAYTIIIYDLGLGSAVLVMP